MGDREFQRLRGISDPGLADYLDRERKYRNWSVPQFAARAGLNRNSVAAILRGDSRPMPETLRALTDALAATPPHGPTKRALKESRQAAVATG